MTRMALVEITTGQVANVIEADSAWRAPSGFILIAAQDGHVSPGDTWSAGKFVPNAMVRLASERAQARHAARERAVNAIKANQNVTPWGPVLLDLVVALGLTNF